MATQATEPARSAQSTQVPGPAPAPTRKAPRNPVPLSATQEAAVRDLYYRNVRAKCAEEIKAFAACANGRTVTATWACRVQRNAMNSCMLTYATQEEQDRAREEWFVNMEIRRREREEKEKKRKEAERKHREWWGLDEKGRMGAADPKSKS